MGNPHMASMPHRNERMSCEIAKSIIVRRRFLCGGWGASSVLNSTPQNNSKMGSRAYYDPESHFLRFFIAPARCVTARYRRHYPESWVQYAG